MIMTLRYNIVRGSIFPSAVFFFTLIRMYVFNYKHVHRIEMRNSSLRFIKINHAVRCVLNY